jgi:hypothetical protein
MTVCASCCGRRARGPRRAHQPPGHDDSKLVMGSDDVGRNRHDTVALADAGLQALDHAQLRGAPWHCMEVKATAAPDGSDARRLVGLRDRLGDTFLAGILFHTGPRAFALAERVTAVPSALWASS